MNIVLILLIGLGILALSGGTAYAVTLGQPIPFIDLFRKYSQLHGVPVRLMVSIVAHESNFNPNALNEESVADERKGRDVDSIGLCQILFPDTAQDYLGSSATREMLYDPNVNLSIGFQHMKKRLVRYPDREPDGFPPEAVAAYNAGSAKQKADGSFVNQEYVNAVRSEWGKYARAT